MQATRTESAAPIPRVALERILVTTDMSDSSRKAFAYAAALAVEFGARIFALYVMEPVPLAAGFEAMPLMRNSDEEIAAARENLTEWLEGCLPGELLFSTLVRQGPPAGEIASAAREINADLLILCTHGHKGMKHLLLGSTAELVVRSAPCPVLVVRDKEHDFITSADASRPPA